MEQKGNYLVPEVVVISFDGKDMIRTSIELSDGISMKYNKQWVDGIDGGDWE